MRVLLIEDDARTAENIERMLKSQKFQVYTTDLGEEGLDLAKLYDYSIIVLDLSLPDISGFEVLRSLRAAKVKTPVIILSGLSSVADKVKGLNLGADDYMTKPFHQDELVARIHAIVRRSNGHTQSVITVGNMAVDIANQLVYVSSTRLTLTKSEYAVIALLATCLGRIISRENILEHVYAHTGDRESNNIDVFIYRLRKKISAVEKGKNYIETHRGQGFRLIEPVIAH